MSRAIIYISPTTIYTMMEPFISKYKPYYLNEFCMDSKTKTILKTLLEIDDINLLFIGNAGCGKTTLLNAIIREYYGLAKTAPIPETNIMFINNLKEQGIHYYRNEMKTFCQSHSSIFGKKKMIVIDDIDYVNEQSQQVFRNYIDKYKHNIHFISVCSNIQKVIESIQSRVHIIRMHPPSIEDIQSMMNTVIEKEGIQIDEESKTHLMMVSNQSMRILIHNLEKVHILGEFVDIELCKKIGSNISLQAFEQYIHCMLIRDLVGGIQILYNIYDYGYSVIDILDYFFAFIKNTSLLTEELKYKIIPFLCKYITVFHIIHEDAIELALFTNDLFAVVESA